MSYPVDRMWRERGNMPFLLVAKADKDGFVFRYDNASYRHVENLVRNESGEIIRCSHTKH